MYKQIAIIILMTGIIACTKEGAKKDSASSVDKEVTDVKNQSRSYNPGDTIKTKSIEEGAEVQNGPLVITYKNGVIKAKGILKNGKKNSLWESFYPDGTKQSSTYFVNGKKNGFSITYHTNGKIFYKGEFKRDKAVGKWEFFDKEGNMVKDTLYK